MALVHLTTAAFDKAVEQGVVLVDFWATWCGPCRMVAPAVEKIAAQYEGRALVGKVDVDAEPALAQRFGIMSIPTLVVLKDGREVARTVGVQPMGARAAMLDEHL